MAYWKLIESAYIPYPKPAKIISAQNVVLKWSKTLQCNYYGAAVGRTVKPLCISYNCPRTTKSGRRICAHCTENKVPLPIPVHRTHKHTHKFIPRVLPSNYLRARPVDPIILKLAMSPSIHWIDIYSLDREQMESVADVVFGRWMENDRYW